MNKQAITFLSLFSLILVLSIYYIMVPPVEEAPVSTTSSHVSNIESMQDERNTAHENTIANNNEVIASASSNEKDINTALANIQETKDVMNQEEELANLIKKKGYKEVYVEVGKSNVKVVINKKEASSQDANQVIRVVNEKMGNNYEVEVKFIAD